MPNVLKFNGYRLFFYSNENDEPIAIAYNHGFTSKEIREIKEAIFSNQHVIEEKWNEYFTE
ncbi:MAG: hypothetical protein PF448_09940 [Bacteroidales bacterium]|jgi:hypothetical protein|nr:hypothetical protein [Bacteroidales bacterium]